MNISITPKKDYIEGDYESAPDMIIPAQKYVNAQVTNNWYVSIGSNRYFKTSNPRIHPYIGAVAGFQMARIETTEPYTGKTYSDGEDEDSEEGLPEHVYLAAGKAGQMFGIKGAAVAGLEYCLAKGMIGRSGTPAGSLPLRRDTNLPERFRQIQYRTPQHQVV